VRPFSDLPLRSGGWGDPVSSISLQERAFGMFRRDGDYENAFFAAMYLCLGYDTAALLREWGIRAARRGPNALGGLTAREREILALLAEGLSIARSPGDFSSRRRQSSTTSATCSPSSI
jgi:hypothetical protein